ncbi:AlpA family transcriptional regulator [Seleniivibrio woodruffii]|uniref:helix-turn-helix transcriptional regulator n=1 Tax=Seleniivibrio woodruffii TaxID=1078050 RepID=UPI0026F1ED44|nr:AlpA family transcriptional regulator [Seleniivibrio woodruffii]
MAYQLLRRNDVEELTGLSRSAIYQKMQQGDFPKQIKLGERTVAWLETDVTQWIESKITASRGN